MGLVLTGRDNKTKQKGPCSRHYNTTSPPEVELTPTHCATLKRALHLGRGRYRHESQTMWQRYEREGLAMTSMKE